MWTNCMRYLTQKLSSKELISNAVYDSMDRTIIWQDIFKRHGMTGFPGNSEGDR